MDPTSDVFVSYRRKNVGFVKQLVSALEDRGKQLWVDWTDIPPGAASYTDEIERGIDGAHVFLAVLSPDYLISPHCLAELNHAAAVNKRIIPIVYEKFDGTPVPEAIQRINWIHFVPHAGQQNDFDTAFTHMLQAIESDYAHIVEHTRLLQRANDWQRSQHNASFLLRGSALDNAETWLAAAADKMPPAAPLHAEFILKSRRAQSRQQRRLLAGTLVLLAIAVVALGIAVYQFSIATRRADETLSLLIANDARSAADGGDSLTAISRAYYANTFLEDPPAAAQSVLQHIAFSPAPRYVMAEGVPPGLSAHTMLAPGTRIAIGKTLALVAEGNGVLSIRSASDAVEMRLHSLTLESRDDSLIHPAVHRLIADRQANSFTPVGLGYDLAPDGEIVAMGSGIDLVLWENGPNAAERAILSAHNLPIDNVQFSGDGRFLVSAASELQNPNFGRSGTEYFVWDTGSWQVIARFDDFSYNRALLAISEDGRLLLFSENDRPFLSVWDVRNGAQIWEHFGLDYVQDLAYSADGRRVIASTVITRRMAPPDDLRVFDAATGESLAHLSGFESEHLIGLPILPGPDDSSLRVITRNGEVQRLDPGAGTRRTTGQAAVDFINGFSLNGRHIAATDYQANQLVIIELDSASEIGRVPIIGFARAVSISNDGRLMAYTSEDPDTGVARLLVFSLATGGEVARFTNVRGDFAHLHAFSPDGQFVYADSSDLLHVVETDGWQEVQTLADLREPVNDLSFSMDGSRIAAAGQNGGIIVWAAATGEIVFRLEDVGHMAVIALAPDGSALVAGSENGNLAQWQVLDTADTRRWVAENRAILPLSCADRERYGLEPC